MSKLVEWTSSNAFKIMLNVDLVRRRIYTSRPGCNRFCANSSGRKKNLHGRKYNLTLHPVLLLHSLM